MTDALELEKKNLVLHIGDPKTGTSSIQRVLQLELVEGAAGKVSGLVNKGASANAVALARAFTPRGKFKLKYEMSLVDAWLESTQASFPIISSEFFSGSDPAMISRVFNRRHLRRAENMTVIGYVRPHIGRVLAAFTEQIKCGYTLRDFQNWLPKYIESERILYAPRFLRWRDVFGDRFILRPFLRGELKDGDAVMDFFTQVFGTQEFCVKSTVHENQSITAKALAGLNFFNREMAAAGMLPKRRIPLARVISRGLSFDKFASKIKIDRSSAELLEKVYRNDARAMDDAFFGRPLLLPDLDRMVHESVSDPIDLSLNHHLSAAERAVLAGHIAAIGRLLPSEGENWERNYSDNRKRYNLGLPLASEGGGEIQKHLQELSRLLS